MKLYTRTGDDGTTGLFGGERVDKDDPRVCAYGEIDEVNAAVGLAVAAAADVEIIAGKLIAIQSRLFDIGADLATPEDSPHADKIARVDAGDVAEIETWIDEVDAANELMKSFVLPGGTELAARLHMARTVCRRAERAMIALAREEPVTDQALVYVNRLSDLLFAMARCANREAGVADVPWVKKQADES